MEHLPALQELSLEFGVGIVDTNRAQQGVFVERWCRNNAVRRLYAHLTKERMPDGAADVGHGVVEQGQ